VPGHRRSRERALRLAHLAQELGLVVEARRDEGARLRVERIASHQPEGPLSLGGDAPVGSEVGEGGEVRVRGAGLAFLQVAQAQVESDGGVARRAGPGALERGRRLVEGAELVAGNPEAHEGVEPVRILGEYPLEGAGRVGVASLARGRHPLAKRRGTAGEHGECEHETQRGDPGAHR